ncbi:hypothetical protein AVEN_208097-1 [Araneus ventricosus]|uniref:Uncharacterized protein n=1 Tax=Araneus ventricosus TaxID=182803 RepID=A0A4Y2FZD8_ARAVE|nr:hypothetical protein AVEN_208097-1 [Araneus ventricosus]
MYLSDDHCDSWSAEARILVAITVHGPTPTHQGRDTPLTNPPVSHPRTRGASHWTLARATNRRWENLRQQKDRGHKQKGNANAQNCIVPPLSLSIMILPRDRRIDVRIRRLLINFTQQMRDIGLSGFFRHSWGTIKSYYHTT